MSDSAGYAEYDWSGERVFALTRCSTEGDNVVPMRVKFALLGDYAIIADNGKISVMGLFDAINAPVLPFQVPAMFLVVAFECESTEVDRDFALEMQLWAEDGQRVFEHSKTFRFQPPNRPGGKSGHNEILSLYGFPVNAAGDYAFVIMVNGEERARVPLRINEPRSEQAGERE